MNRKILVSERFEKGTWKILEDVINLFFIVYVCVTLQNYKINEKPRLYFV